MKITAIHFQITTYNFLRKKYDKTTERYNRNRVNPEPINVGEEGEFKIC